MRLKRIIAFALALALTGIAAATASAASAVADSGDTAARAAWGRRAADPFGKLLENGVITQETYDKMKAYLESDASRQQQKTERTNYLDELLKAGIITQKDYDALKAAIEAKMSEAKTNLESKKAAIKEKLASGERPDFGGKQNTGDKVQRSGLYSQFVDDGVITQQTADAIKAYFEANRKEKTENAQKPERADMFKKMLDDGVITQQEYDAINAAMSQNGGNFKARNKQNGDTASES